MNIPSKEVLIEINNALFALRSFVLNDMQNREISNDSFYTDGTRDAFKKRLRDIAEAQVFINQLIKDGNNE